MHNLILIILVIIILCCCCYKSEHFTNDFNTYKQYLKEFNSSADSLVKTGLNAGINITINGNIRAGGGTEVCPIGMIVAYPGNGIPPGWLLCNGQVIPGQFGALRNIAGNNTPNLVGRVVIGTGQGPNLTNRDRFAVGGADSHAVTINEMPSHNHSLNEAGAHSHQYMRHGDAHNCSGHRMGGMFTGAVGDNTQGAGAHTHDTTNNGGNGPHNNMQPYVTINYIIRAI